jgi:hypothetical protein
MYNIGMHDYFHHFSGKYPIGARLLDAAESADLSSWQVINEFDVLRLPVSLFLDQPKIMRVLDHFGSTERLSIFRLQPWYNYSWHVDTNRGCSLNMLLSGWDSVSMFGEFVNLRHFKNIAVVDYQPNQLTALNVHRWHSIVNFSSVRYVLSIGIDIQYSFADLVDYCWRHRL